MGIDNDTVRDVRHHEVKRRVSSSPCISRKVKTFVVLEDRKDAWREGAIEHLGLCIRHL